MTIQNINPPLYIYIYIYIYIYTYIRIVFVITLYKFNYKQSNYLKNEINLKEVFKIH